MKDKNYQAGKAAGKTILRLRAEIAKLREDNLSFVKNEVAIHASVMAENAKLRAHCRDLRGYAQHLDDCSWDDSRWNDGPTPCDCGRDALLKDEQ